MAWLTYTLINLPFLIFAGLVFWRSKPNLKPVLAAGLILLVLTVIFDPIIIGLGFVEYDFDKTVGLRIFGAPIEDYSYSLAAIILMPAIWLLLGGKNDQQD